MQTNGSVEGRGERLFEEAKVARPETLAKADEEGVLESEHAGGRDPGELRGLGREDFEQLEGVRLPVHGRLAAADLGT
jgi:hypothetical protein